MDEKAENQKLLTGILKITARGIVLAIALIAFLMASYGWFASNNSADAQGGSVRVAINNGASIQEFHVYKRDGQSNGAAEVSNNVKGDPLYNMPVSMTEYDTVFDDKNVDTPMIVKIIIGDVANGSTNLRITVSCPNGNYIVDDKLATYISNICDIRCGVGTAELNAKTAADDIYAGAISLLSTTTPQSFVSATEENGDYTLADEKKLQLTFDLNDLTPTDGILVVYIELSYNDSLAMAYIQKNGVDITNSSATGSDFCEFENDLTSFIFDYNREEVAP